MAAYASTAGDTAADGDAGARRATTLVVAVLGLLAISEAGYGVADGGLGEAPFVVALAVLPMLYVIPATRRWWLRHRYLLLAAQAALTYAPFFVFGSSWASGPSGWLAGLVLLTLPFPASWLVFASLAVAEEALRAGLVGLPYASAPSAALWVLIAFAIDALVLYGHGFVIRPARSQTRCRPPEWRWPPGSPGRSWSSCCAHSRSRT